MRSDRPLAGQAILITGASGGIGRALVRAVARLGAEPILHYGRDEAGAGALLDEIGGRGWLVQADLAEAQGADSLWRRALGLAGCVHGLVNNAGLRTAAALDGDALVWRNGWERDLRVNLLAPADLCRAAVLHFREHGGGRIVNIASRAAQRGYVADFMPYGASKAGLINLTKSLARNYGGAGIVAIAVAPGFVRTNMAEDYIARHGLDAATGDIPIKAMVEPEELAELVGFCLLPAQRSLNGATLDVNGGSYLR